MALWCHGAMVPLCHRATAPFEKDFEFMGRKGKGKGKGKLDNYFVVQYGYV